MPARLGKYYAVAKGEKAYLHLDRPVYATGETIWFSAYVVDASRHQARLAQPGAARGFAVAR
ncbi:hypothetical protein ACFQT0_00780 [Hymenobacter humi]|uniref:Uncharacterized protein n=1 Tax=Hymenobacter humi TaxID=1411620 RepID=A0ABW2U0Y4_9BACT